MLTWIVSGLDTSDLVVLTLLAGGAIVFFVMKVFNQQPTSSRYEKSS